MRLIIVRHGKAEAEAPSGRDSDRLLRPKGEQQARFVAEALAGLSPRPDRIVSSGIVRAIQTARVLQQGLGISLRVEPGLETGAAASAALELLERERRGKGGGGGGAGGLVIVGHNPQLEELAGLLLRGPVGPAPVIRTGEALVLDLPQADLGSGGGTLVETIRLADE